MWNASGPEYSRVIDPQLKWKISSNVKPRALRRARTFAQDNKKKVIVKNVKDSEDLFDKDSKKKGDMLVSESEKLVVSILGWRFKDNLEIVPTKKRRFSLPSSPSPPNLSPSSDFFDQNHESHFSLFLNNKVSVKQDEPSIKSSCRVDWDREGGSADEKRSLEETDEQICDSADFYGISILAAAACDSSVETLVNEEGPGVIGHPYEENPVLVKVSEPQRGMGYLISYDPELGEIKANSSAVSFATVEALSRELGKIKPVESKRENSVSSLQNSLRKMKSVPSRDNRLHWDLNSVMDAWKTQPDDLSNSVPHDSNISVAVCTEENCGLLQTEVCGPLPEDCQYMDAKVMVETATMKTNLADNREKSCLVSSDAYPVEGLAELATDLFTKTVDVPEEEKCETDCTSFNIKVDTHVNLPHLIIPGNASVGWTKNDCGPLAEDKKVNDTLHDESTSIGTIDSVSDHSAECNLVYVRRKRNNPLKSPNFKKHQSLSTDDIAPGVTAQSPASKLKDTCGMVIHGNDEKTFLVPIDRSNSKNMTSEGCLSDEAACNEEFRNFHASANQSESLFFNLQGTSDHVQLPSRSALIQKYERTTADVKVKDSYILSGENSNTIKSASVHICSKLTNSTLEGMVQDMYCIPSVDDALNSNGACSAPATGQMRSLERISLEEHYDSEYHSDASPIEADLASDMENVEFLGDDDSQYEDGELSESVLNSWGEDGAEEVEIGYVDYGSEEIEFLKSGSYFDSQYGSEETEFLMETGYVDYDSEEIEFFKSGSYFGSQYGSEETEFLKTKHVDYAAVNWTYSDASMDESASGESARGTDVSSVRRDYNGASEWDKLPRGECAAVNWNYNDSSRVERSTSEGSCRMEAFCARDENRLMASAVSADVGDVLGRSSQPACSRMKSSGWDKLPRGEYAAVNWNYNDASLAPSVSGESARRTGGVSSVRRDYNDVSGWDKWPRSEYAAVNWNYNDASLAPSVSGESARRTGVSSVRRGYNDVSGWDKLTGGMDYNDVSGWDKWPRGEYAAVNWNYDDASGRDKLTGVSSVRRDYNDVSGWDKWPRGEYAAVNWNYNDASLAPSVSGESARRTGVSSVRRDYNDVTGWDKLPRGEYAAVNWNYNDASRVERSTSSEGSCRGEVFYSRENRKHDHIDLNAQRNSKASRSLGSSRLSFGSHGRGRGESWGEKEIEEETQPESESNRPEGRAAEEVHEVARMTELVPKGASIRRSRRPFDRALGRTEFVLDIQDVEENVGSDVQITNQVEEYIPQPVATIPRLEMNEGPRKNEQDLKEIKQALKRHGALERPYEGGEDITVPLPDEMEGEVTVKNVELTAATEAAAPIAAIGESLPYTLAEEVVPTLSFDVNIPTITSERSEALVDHLTVADLRMQIRRDIMDELTCGSSLEAYRKRQDEIAERSRLMCNSMIEMSSILKSLEARLGVLESTVSVYNKDLVDVKEDMCHWVHDFSVQNDNHYLMQEDIKKLLVDSEWCTNGVYKLQKS